MAQTGYTPILIYSSSTASNLPSASNLTNSTLGSELAINITDGKLFYKDNANAVQVIGWKTTPTSAGGTGLTSYTAGDMIYYASGTALSKLAIGATGRWLGSSGTAPQWNAPAALTKTDDTNVTLTLGGSASTALLNAASLTLGWTGTLAVSRGGTGTGTAFTTGSVLFAGASGVYSQDNANFFWDDSNNRLGIGTSSPGRLLELYAAGSPVLRWNDSSTTWDIRTNGSVGSAMQFDYNGTRFFTLLNSGDLQNNTGNYVPATAAKGINFTANTAAAGMTSQLLNWYEEGTWTPALSGSGTAGTYELATASGWYTRVGRQVTVIFNVKLAAAVTGGGTGFAVLSGLPFSVATTAATAGAVTLGGVNYTAGTNYVTVMPRSVGSSSMIFEETNINGAVNDAAISAFGVNDTIQGTLTYLA